ncbi:MAG: stage III sporulation protein AB [Ruminococcus callidus]|nr:stage III sporulation protein AB [Ruminococcus callidus]
MKNMFIFVLFVLISLSGPMYLYSINKKNNYTKASAESLRIISNDIGYKAMPLFEIIDNLSNSSKLYYYKKLSNKNYFCNFENEWIDVINNDLYLEIESKEILIQVGNVIGKTNASRQYELLNKYADDLEKIYSEKRDEIKKKSKIYNSTGILFGLFVVIMFI